MSTTATTASRIVDVTPTYERENATHDYGTRWVYVGADALDLLRAARIDAERLAAFDPERLAVRVTREYDLDSESPITWDSCVSLAVVGPKYNRNGMPEEWTHDAYTYEVPGVTLPARLDAASVAHWYREGGEGWSTNAEALALRALSLSGARGISTVSILSHSGEWLSWSNLAPGRGYVPGSAAGEIGDALAWVPTDVIAADYRTAAGNQATYSPERGWCVELGGQLLNVDQEVETWAAATVNDYARLWDTYVRGEVYTVTVEIADELDECDRDALADRDDESVAWSTATYLGSVYGDDADPTRGDGWTITDQVGECVDQLAVGRELAAQERAERERNAAAAGDYVI